MLRQARYGIQFLFLPFLTISLFFSTYAAVRALGGQTKGLFYPFLTFLISATTAGIPMQSGNQILREPSSASLLVTKRGLSALITYFSGMQVAYLTTSVATIVVAYLSVRPSVNPVGFLLALLLLCGWCLALLAAGLAMGMRLIFAFQVSQFIFLGFYLFLVILPLAGKPIFSLIFPPAGIIAVFEGRVIWFKICCSRWLASSSIT